MEKKVHPVDSPTKNVDGIRLHGGGSYGATVTSSSGTSGGTAGSVSLSSPESAYSTGYSTDGTSPGTSFPPEYYINIRTGTHYFQSSSGTTTTTTTNNNNNNNNNNSNKARLKRLPGEVAELPAAGSAATGNGRVEDRGQSSASTTNMTRDNGQPEVRTNTSNKSAETPTNHGQRQQQQQQQQQQQRQEENFHRRTESYSADSRNSLPVPSSIPPPLVSASVQSPRERSRIRTNPWLSANSSGSSTNGLKSRLALDESSSSSGLKLTESSGSASDVNLNLNGRELQSRKEHRQESLSAGRSPINQNWRITSGMDLRPKIPLALQRRASSSSSSASSVTRSVRSSDDDITLNEMMGKFDESYVYEKETDILSDSDPTDCEDYIDSLSDIDTGQDGGDENDPFENDELDYIDNGSFLDLDNIECGGHLPNTGHCTYFAFTSELSRRGTRLRESFLKRRTKDELVSQRSTSARTSTKRQSTRHKKMDDKQSEKRKKRISQRRKPVMDRCDDETANLNRVLVERMLLKNSGFNQGSRSVGGTPMCLRRRKHDVNKNLSPMRLNGTSSAIRPVVIENEIVKRRSNSISYVNGNIVRRHVAGNTYMTTFASEIALIEADKEADRKYRELILEAENILVSMQKHQNSSPCVPSPSRKLHNGLANKRVELIKNTELNIELALSKSRNSQPELQSGSIRDLEHTSPKRQFAQQPCSPIHRFMERNSAGFAPKELPLAYRQHEMSKCSDSPATLRRMTPQSSPSRSLMHHQVQATRARNGELEIRECNRSPRIALNCNGGPKPEVVNKSTSVEDKTFANATFKSSLAGGRKEFRAVREPMKEEGVTSSSSDSEEKCDVRRRAPLMTFRSIDMGPIKESSSYCPQSEPVKRKVYAGSATYGRIQKTLGEHVMLRNSDGDTATDDTDDSRRSLKEKVAQLRQERLAAEANANNAQDSQYFQHQLSQLRRQMLMQTIEGLKRSLEDQSATLKQTCLEPTSLLTDELP
ncbi:myb-like protein AA isoform X2 [Pseudomyrmex gracilis]|uniref:myb-like protein AA isoform X2 n=1 Tax=Pseudomyrmex gracilis TaxID=219809 RepID=UPI000995441E|nr:myb-like protein AA isoform X2 [Pseudomyrmex gracilis]